MSAIYGVQNRDVTLCASTTMVLELEHRPISSHMLAIARHRVLLPLFPHKSKNRMGALATMWYTLHKRIAFSVGTSTGEA